ncbi:hypothetical protein [Synechococcus sp. UW140]|uniref:hypothetical protein n=1 Tax=Synechococcus sp. UW140 TaxID=368503 RepID=UPI0025F7D68F|nr:hypothetical protein [Synechococcus sp. UW140]
MATAEPDWSQRFSKWSKEAEALAIEAEGNPIALLAVLRELEKLHRSLQDGPLRNSLPADRRRLFALLQSIEQSGGWPYIPRLQIQTFLEMLKPRDQSEA